MNLPQVASIHVKEFSEKRLNDLVFIMTDGRLAQFVVAHHADISKGRVFRSGRCRRNGRAMDRSLRRAD